MALTISLRKLHSGALVPVDAVSSQAVMELKTGNIFRAILTMPRNYKFHKKAFALLTVVFEAWKPGEILHKGQPVQKNIERLREDMTILAGYYSVEFNWKGEPRFKADSWSFASMDEITFAEMYSKLIDVALAKILGSQWTIEDIDHAVEKVLSFS